MANYSQKAEATLAVSSTGSGPTPPRGMSRTAAPGLLKLMPASASLGFDGRNARPPEGKRDAEVGRANTTAARNGRSFILAMVRRLDFEQACQVRCEILFFGPVCHPVNNGERGRAHLCQLCLIFSFIFATNNGEHGTPRYPKAPASHFSRRICRRSFIATSIDVGIHVRSRSNPKPPRAADIIGTNSHQVARPATDAERTGEGAERPAAPDYSAEWRR